MEENKDLSPEEQEIKDKEQKNKIQNNFNQNVEKITAILQKVPDKKGRKKIGGTAIDDLVKELFKEDDEKLQAEVKTELRNLLEGYVSLWREVDNKEKELEKLKNDKMKEFNEKALKLFNKIDGLPELIKKYSEGLKKAAEATGKP